jgi:hypothetical protein
MIAVTARAELDLPSGGMAADGVTERSRTV